MIIKILNNTTPYGKIMASHEGSLHSSTLKRLTLRGRPLATPHASFIPKFTNRSAIRKINDLIRISMKYNIIFLQGK